MKESYIFHLKQPCKNREIDFHNNGDGSITLDGNHFFNTREAEEYIESKPRLDLPPIDQRRRK